MPIGSSRYFNDPNLAAAASNLSALFAPPSGGDAAGWATANAKRAEASRMAALFDYQNSPEFNQQQFDRMGAAAGAWTPNQGYYAVDEGNAVARRGQDVTASTALSTNAADNARALEVARANDQNEIAKTLLAPVGADATRFIPKSIADLYDTGATQVGVPANAADNARALEVARMEDAAARRGQDVTARTSTTNNAADNARALETNRLSELGNLFDPLAQDATRPAIPADIASQFGVGHGLVAEHGKDSPLSETEFNAAVLGTMPPEQQRAVAFGSTPIDPIVTPNGPRNVLRTDAIGEIPYDKPTGGLNVEFDENGKVKSIGTGGAGGDKGLTADQSRLANFSMTAEAMLAPLDQMGAELTDFGGSLAANVPGGYGNYLQSEGYQKARIVGERFVQSVLRNESGAATPADEVAKYNGTLLPAPGDKPGTIRLKSWVRKVAAEAMDTGLGKAARMAKIDAAIAAGPPPDFMPATGAPTDKPSTPADAAAPAEVVAPVTAPSPTSGTAEGTIIENDAGKKMIRRNGTWEPYSG